MIWETCKDGPHGEQFVRITYWRRPAVREHMTYTPAHQFDISLAEPSEGSLTPWSKHKVRVPSTIALEKSFDLLRFARAAKIEL